MIGPIHFINNKYYRWYNSLVECARSRTYDSQLHEKHHLYPESFGGTRTSCVPLTFREHFLCHWLLTKFTTGKAKMKMCYALSKMKCAHKGHSRNLSTWQYEVSRKSVVGIKRPEHMERLRQINTGKVGWRKGLPSPFKGKKRGPSKLKGRTRPPDVVAKIKANAKGIPKSPEHKEKIRQARLGSKRI